MAEIGKGVIYKVLYTQNAKEIAEKLGYDITGKQFRLGCLPSPSTVRGYVEIEGKLRGPVTLYIGDIEKVM